MGTRPVSVLTFAGWNERRGREIEGGEWRKEKEKEKEEKGEKEEK